MNRDIEALRMYIFVVVVLASLGVTSIPVIYSFSAWRSTPLGRAYMTKAISFAVAMDMTLLFMIWSPANILIRFWINAILLTGIGLTSFWMAWQIWSIGHPKRKKVVVQFSSPVYDKLKFVAQILLPAAGTLYFTVAQIWGLPSAEEVSGTILAVDTFLGVLLGISSNTYKSSGQAYDGTMVIEPTEDGSQLRMKSVDLEALASKQHITFKVVNQVPEPAPE